MGTIGQLSHPTHGVNREETTHYLPPPYLSSGANSSVCLVVATELCVPHHYNYRSWFAAASLARLNGGKPPLLFIQGTQYVS